MSTVEIRVPAIGDFKNIPVVEVHVKPGSILRQEDPIITLESDKATMDVPSPHAGKLVELLVKPGDKVSEGTPIARMDVAGADNAAQDKKAPAAQVSAPITAPTAAAFSSAADVTCDVMVLGAGPGGYSAAFRAADLGLNVVLIERSPTLGGVCLNVGCIPSKALLHTAAIIDEAAALGAHGIKFGKPEINLDALRGHKDKVVGKLTTGLAGMAKARKVTVIKGVGTFLDPHHIEVTLAAGGRQVVKFAKAIIAAGSEAVNLPFIPKDPRIVDSTGALELRQIPKKMLVIGGGIIGLEMATVYSTLGTRLDVVEMLDGLMPGADRDLVRVWEKKNAPRFDAVMLKSKTVAVGRSPNGKLIGADKAGVAVDQRGYIPADRQMRTNVAHIFAIGDITCQPMLAHKAVHEGHVAAEVAAGMKSAFDAKQIPSVAYTDPEIAWAGKTEDQLRAEGAKFAKAVFPWAASGRAIANGRDEGFTKLLFDADTHQIIGGGIVGTHAGDLISEICLAIEMGADATDIGKTIHPHPTLSESVGMAAEVFEGVCTDLPPVKKAAAGH